jgi:hypothetical protein
VGGRGSGRLGMLFDTDATTKYTQPSRPCPISSLLAFFIYLNVLRNPCLLLDDTTIVDLSSSMTDSNDLYKLFTISLVYFVYPRWVRYFQKRGRLEANNRNQESFKSSY